MDGVDEKGEHKYSYLCRLYDETGGKTFESTLNREVFVEDVLNYIYGKVPSTSGAYNAIIATGYHTVVLDKPLTEKDMENSKKLFDNPFCEFSASELKDCADTDGDGLYDFQEIMFYNKIGIRLVSVNNGVVHLPSVSQVMNEYASERLAFVEAGLEKAKEQYGNCWNDFCNTYTILPINSDPTNPDGDGDDLKDSFDPKPLCKVNNGVVMNEFKGNKIDSEYTTILQQCLKHLGYLDMTNPDYNPNKPEDPVKNSKETPYGVFGGLTKAAVQLFQLNHRLDPLYANDPKDEYMNYEVDYYTFQMIISAAVSKGFRLNGHETFSGEEEYKYIQFMYIKENKLPYFSDIKNVKPILTEAEKKNGVTFYPKTKNTDIYSDSIFYLDLTVPINDMLKKNAKECHNHCYVCINSFGKYKCTRIDDTIPFPFDSFYLHPTTSIFKELLDGSTYLWFFSKVNSGAEWDIKRKNSWNGQFNAINNDITNTYPSIDDQIRFFHSSFEFYYNGDICTPEILGNIMLGYTGTACGFSENELVCCSSFYNLWENRAWDSKEDSYNIRVGVSMFNELKENKYTFDEYFHN